MKGIIFNLFEEVTTQQHGADHWDDVLDESGASGSYTSLGSYDDAELVGLASAEAAATDRDIPQVLGDFGEHAMPHLADRYAVFFEPHTDTRSFLLTLNAIIHAEVRKLYPGANPPNFDIDATDPSVLRMTYRSERKMCSLAEGFIRGAASHYREHVGIGRPSCMHRGDETCVFELTFENAAQGTGA